MNAPLPFQEFQYAFAQHIRSPRHAPRPAGVPQRRMQIYNELLYNNLVGFLDACFPVSRKLLGERRWARLGKAFFAQWRSLTPYFREIPREFLRWLMENDSPVALPPFMIELMHYEWVELAVDVMEAPLHADVDAQGDLLAGRPVVNPALMNLSYQWPVHRIGPTWRPRKPKPTQLLVLRNNEDKVRFIELNPLSSRLLALLQPGRMSGLEALGQIANELGHADPQAIVDSGHEIMLRLRTEQAILGVST